MPKRDKPGAEHVPRATSTPEELQILLSELEPLEDLDEVEDGARTVIDPYVSEDLDVVDPSEDITPRPELEPARALSLPRPTSDVRVREAGLEAVPPRPRSKTTRVMPFVFRDVGTAQIGGGRLRIELFLGSLLIGLVIVYSSQNSFLHMSEEPKAVVQDRPSAHQPASWADSSVNIQWVAPAPRPERSDESTRAENEPLAPKRTSFVDDPAQAAERTKQRARQAANRPVIDQRGPPILPPPSKVKDRDEARAQRPMIVAARAADAQLKIFSTPPGATVELDGKEIGQTPIVRPAPAGKQFLVRLRMAKHATITRPLAPDGTGNFNLNVTLH